MQVRFQYFQSIALVRPHNILTLVRPHNILKVVVAVLLLGLPLALFFSWAFELTPDGIKREADVDRGQFIALSWQAS